VTTIAIRDGVIAADTQETWEDGSFTPCVKLYRMPWDAEDVAGHIVGLAGGSYAGELFLEWYRDGDRDEKPDLTNLDLEEDFEAIVLRPDGTLWSCNRLFTFIPHKTEYFATGSGGKVALGAMAMGATAEEAVAAAIKHDCYTGGDIQVMTIRR